MDEIHPNLPTIHNLVEPVLEDLITKSLFSKTILIPVYTILPADLLTPVIAYLKLVDQSHSPYSFLLESVHGGGETIGRYSFIGVNPFQIITTGDHCAYKGDPLLPIQHELDQIEFVKVPGLPSFTGGAVGYISFDCIEHFEPKTKPNIPLLDDDLADLPESIFLFCNDLVVFDHLHNQFQIVTHLKFPVSSTSVEALMNSITHQYGEAQKCIGSVTSCLSNTTSVIPLPIQLPIPSKIDRVEPTSNVGKEGYMQYVRTLQHHIKQGDIFQAVPSQRMHKPTKLHPFNAYRHLRSSNPSPYMYYLNMNDFQIVGASPEMLVKYDTDSRKVYTHPIAGTRKRGNTLKEDQTLAHELLNDPKERSEHIMLVDLGRNDVNRVCIPKSVTVESFMHIERYSHVMHIVSVVSGILRSEQTRFNAFRSIFPAGTVSGAPKIKAIELIRGLEQRKRNVYAGAICHFDYSGSMDTCIAIRTLVFRNGVAYLQAGGGIVLDSVPEDEYMESVNKMMSSAKALSTAEEYYDQLQKMRSVPPFGNVSSKKIVCPPIVKSFSGTDLPKLHTANTIYNLPKAFPDPIPVTLLIDNYCSFTMNVYQFLRQQGANVIVFRNDEITIDTINKIANLKHIAISPGPGHPIDSGITLSVLEHFSGRIPILGVCLGQQAMFHYWGGTVTYAGSILHGKTSSISHDGKGLFRGIPQHFSATRYHSLAADKQTLPDCLEISSWTDDGIIMGVRHKLYTVEGVQFHPESVLSEHGAVLTRNFLGLHGGTWAENDTSYFVASSALPPIPCTDNTLSPSHVTGSDTILDKIYRQRRTDIDLSAQNPGRSLNQLRDLVSYGHNLPPVDIYARLTKTANLPAVMAEVKRASPSKGTIDGMANAGLCALKYAYAGASVISVLTEPTWFKGSIQDLCQVHNTLVRSFGEDRPALLLKDFVFSEYQIIEARLNGADAVLLIVAMLTDDELIRLLRVTRSLGMEALVEVNNSDEMQRALTQGARIVGVNNRNLHTFEINMCTTTSIAELVPKDVVLCALSGIFSRTDLLPFLETGVRAVLVGEALMRAPDSTEFIRGLWGLERHQPSTTHDESSTLVKICGLRTTDELLVASNAGADMLGIVFVPKTKRYVSPKQAAEMITEFRQLTDGNKSGPLSHNLLNQNHPKPFKLASIIKSIGRPLIVGVFQNASRPEILDALNTPGVDLVQLHGKEDPILARYLPVPVIKAYSLPLDQTELLSMDEHTIPLLDSPKPGSGTAFDWDLIPAQFTGSSNATSGKSQIILAGGLNPDNVCHAIETVCPLGVDVSSGVEDRHGNKCKDLICSFINNVRSVALKQ